MRIASHALDHPRRQQRVLHVLDLVGEVGVLLLQVELLRLQLDDARVLRGKLLPELLDGGRLRALRIARKNLERGNLLVERIQVALDLRVHHVPDSLEDSIHHESNRLEYQLQVHGHARMPALAERA